MSERTIATSDGPIHETTTSERTEVIILGRMIGTTGTGWDQGDTFCFCVHDFEPVAGVALPAVPCIWFNFETGKFEIYSDDGRVIRSFDMVTILRDVPLCDE